jgi:hypothetical protein
LNFSFKDLYIYRVSIFKNDANPIHRMLLLYLPGREGQRHVMMNCSNNPSSAKAPFRAYGKALLFLANLRGLSGLGVLEGLA